MNYIIRVITFQRCLFYNSSKLLYTHKIKKSVALYNATDFLDLQMLWNTRTDRPANAVPENK